MKPGAVHSRKPTLVDCCQPNLDSFAGHADEAFPQPSVGGGRPDANDDQEVLRAAMQNGRRQRRLFTWDSQGFERSSAFCSLSGEDHLIFGADLDMPTRLDREQTQWRFSPVGPVAMLFKDRTWYGRLGWTTLWIVAL